MGLGSNVCPVFMQSLSGECEGFTGGNQEAENRTGSKENRSRATQGIATQTSGVKP